MNKFLQIFIGLILLVASIYLCFGTTLWGLRIATINFLKGGITWLIILIGLILIGTGISELKE